MTDDGFGGFRELDDPADDAIADVETEFDSATVEDGPLGGAAPEDELIDDALTEEALTVDGLLDDEPAVPSPTGWRPPERTGVPAVDEAVAVLAELDGLPTGEHVAYYEAAHRHLQDALADLDGA